MQDLDRDSAPDLGVGGGEDLSHAAFGEIMEIFESSQCVVLGHFWRARKSGWTKSLAGGFQVYSGLE